MPSAIAAIRLLMLTGCRSDEILNLKWDDVDRTARVLRLPDSKTGPRMVPLTGPVTRVLDGIERADDVPWVLRGTRAGSRLACLSWHWRRIRPARPPGLDDVEFAPGGVDTDAEARQVAVPEDRVLAVGLQPFHNPLGQLEGTSLGHRHSPGPGNQSSNRGF